MARYVTTVPSPWSPEEAFDYLAQFDHVADWDPGVDGARALDDEVAQGSRFEVVVSTLGRRIPLEYRIVEMERPHRVVLVADASTFRSRDVITVTPTADGCSVTYDAELELRGPLRLADPLLVLAFQRIGDRAAEGLREAVGRPTT